MNRHGSRGPVLAGVLGAALSVSALACSGNVITEKPGGTGGDGGGSGTTDTTAFQGKTNKVDLLLAIDNSRSMGDKQDILAVAVPDLVARLVNPPCLDGQGKPAAVPPGFGPLDACPDGTQREHIPVLDIHVGIVSSSLGGHGSDACSSSAAGKQSNNDRAHLLARKDPASFDEVETYQGLKFLAWDPAQTLSPPGEADLDVDTASDANMTALVPSLREMVLGVGQIGCGYEAQMEAWYRFLVDPTPPEEVTIDDNGAVLLKGTDKVLLAQRKAFLRPDSALAIVVLSDEDDCSIRESGQYYYVAQLKGQAGGAFHLPAARAVCSVAPGDECCYSCGQSGPKDANGNPICPDDPSCKGADGNVVYYGDLDDHINVRCFDQKRRFGIDFLYPIDRYVSALTEKTVIDRNGEVVPNPIYSDLDPSDEIFQVRDPSLVLLAGIVGVPWQDIARTNANGVARSVAGIDFNGKATGGFKNAEELGLPLPGEDSATWDVILGDPGELQASPRSADDPQHRPALGEEPDHGRRFAVSPSPSETR
ncbi:MAG: hypothetical protein R3B70_00510 [Polyangiaceae bacterium]